MKSICFTGHRQIDESSALKECLQKKLKEMIAAGCTDFYAGGAIGWDTLCAGTILTLRGGYPHIRLHLVLPCSPEEQTAKWKDAEKSEYYYILRAADSVEQISVCYQGGCMKRRNAKLVEYADICVCYYHPQRIRSGTGQTVRMAEKKGLPICNFAEVE